jgi:hypothetical protein
MVRHAVSVLIWLVLAVRGLGGSNAASCERADVLQRGRNDNLWVSSWRDKIIWHRGEHMHTLLHLVLHLRS